MIKPTHERIADALKAALKMAQNEDEREALHFIVMHSDEDANGEYISLAERIDILAEAQKP